MAKLLIIFLYCICANGEQFNLQGDAGLAYSVEVIMGHPHQKINLLIDTGSTTLAVASYSRQDSDKYFDANNSSSIYDSGKKVQATYFEGKWIGRLVSDYIQLPSMPLVPEVRTDMALIMESHNFFMNGSQWQGLLGLAYLPVGARGADVIVESWLDSLDRTLTRPVSFQLKLCATLSTQNATHYGNFQILDGKQKNENLNKSYRTTIIQKRWYEVGVLSVRVMRHVNKSSNPPDIDEHMCQTLNKIKAIVDSGTTNIRLPNCYFRQIVDDLRSAAQTSNMLITDDFWYAGETGCWPEPQDWSLPWVAVDLLSYEADNQYFTLMLSPQNYMRVVAAQNSSGESGTVSEYCYKLGFEKGGDETVLGYTAMEGFQVLFNRSAGWIGWQTSDCGPNTKIMGPFVVSSSLKSKCKLIKSAPDSTISIKAAQWALSAISVIAASILLYLLYPCIKTLLTRRLRSPSQISMSQAALVEQEST
ncbi:beta-secretase 1 [Bombyx mori]|uniref:Peptidase A1 domain-containing protein n=1 Tax=Bombyx mori TaxID=7091 RepID=A0A8R2C987_BOMMO|nr:beta-secretase 1 [Bombyx mori]